MDKFLKVKLLNLRGRVVEVEPHEVKKLLLAGFIKVTNPHIKPYEPSFDRGDLESSKFLPQQQIPTIRKSGDELEVKIV